MFYLGVDLGGTNIKAGIIDRKGQIIKKASVRTNVQRPAHDIIEQISVLCKDLLKSANLTIEQISGIGAGCPGAVSQRSGVIEYSNNLNWHNVPFKDLLSGYFVKPIRISNDANVAALGETLFGAGKNYKNTVLISLGTGVGGGIVIDNKLYEGNDSKGGELGHMVIVVDGEQCTCGRRGCMEAYCSATALIRQTKNAIEACEDTLMKDVIKAGNKISAKTVFEYAQKGDKVAIKIIENFIKYLGESLLNLGNIFRPEAIIVGGGLCNEGDYLLDKLKVYCQSRHYGYKGSPVFDIIAASLKNDAGIIGAAALFM